MTRAFKAYCKIKRVDNPLHLTDRSSRWITAGDVCVTTQRMDAFGLIHLHMASWQGLGKTKNECNSNYELIEPFLNYECNHAGVGDVLHWKECGSLTSSNRV